MAAPALRANAPGLTLRAAFTLSLVLISAASQTCADVDGGDADDAFSSCSLYADHPSDCGKFDDEDFTAAVACCACGGGSTARQADDGLGADIFEADDDELEAVLDNQDVAAAAASVSRVFDGMFDPNAPSRERILQSGQGSYDYGDDMYVDDGDRSCGSLSSQSPCYDTAPDGSRDSDGNSCTYWGYMYGTIACAGDWWNDDDFTAVEMCCGCGGGSTTSDPPTHGPTSFPTGFPMLKPTSTPSLEPTSEPTGTFGPTTSTDPPTASPTTLNPTLAPSRSHSVRVETWLSGISCSADFDAGVYDDAMSQVNQRFADRGRPRARALGSRASRVESAIFHTVGCWRRSARADLSGRDDLQHELLEPGHVQLRLHHVLRVDAALPPLGSARLLVLVLLLLHGRHDRRADDIAALRSAAFQCGHPGRQLPDRDSGRGRRGRNQAARTGRIITGA